MMQPRESNIHDLHDSSGRDQESNGHDLFDRISDLPDSILGIILSFLPTKKAVATSILSKRWELVWRTIQNFQFCFSHYNIKVGDEEMKFIRFVDRVLLLHDAGMLNQFHLDWYHNSIPSRAISWIKTAIRRNVRDIFLSVQTSGGWRGVDAGPLEMPTSVFNCDSLHTLVLFGNISVSGTAVCLPKLESLILDSVFFECEEDFEKFISGCPMLNYLDMHMYISNMLRDYGLDDFTYIIASTSLRHLKLNFKYSHLHGKHTYFRLKLDTCSLEYLKLKGFIYEIVVQKCLGSLSEARLKIEVPINEFSKDNFCNSFVEAVRAFNCAKVLILSTDIMRALNCATISLSTKFTRLMKLETRTYCCDCCPLPDLLQSSDNLEVLTIYQDSRYINRHDCSNWTDPAQVPRCLSNSLKKVVIDGYYVVSANDCNMIRYLLKYGSALETMKISCSISMPKRTKFMLHQEISDFPNKSKVDI